MPFYRSFPIASSGAVEELDAFSSDVFFLQVRAAGSDRRGAGLPSFRLCPRDERQDATFKEGLAALFVGRRC